MDAEQRYIEETNFIFEEDAYDKVAGFKSLGYYLSVEINDNAHKFEVKNGIIQNYGVMVTTDEDGDIPFELEVFNNGDELPVLVDVRQIHVDDYIEILCKNKSITHEKAKKKR